MSIKCYEFLVTECKILDAGLSECGTKRLRILDCGMRNAGLDN